ncbi:MAG: F0F1 ATP synthase subunit alpha [bacterium]|nr:F0F1 ATP synthase subunit alpha [bacterium]
MQIDSQQEVGFVTAAKDFLIFLDGLPHVKINEIVENEKGTRGWVTSLQEDLAEVLLLDPANPQPGDIFKRTHKTLALDVGDFLLGRAINPLGVAIDGKTFSSKTANSVPIDTQAPSLQARQFITEQLETGITLLDTLIPVGKGQRELIIGDARAGKTNFLINLIVNQGKKGVTCVYAAIGKPSTDVRHIIDILESSGALKHTCIVAAPSTESAPLIFIAPHTAMTIAEYYQKQGKDVLVILDDLGNHAKIYREISLLGNKTPGREAYPGDMFYQHAHLLERAGKFKKEAGGGSITALPVIELNLNDFTSYIPTNVMSMTDGHLLFKSSIYNQGQRPAVDIPFSVSRVGRQTQPRIVVELADKLRNILAQASELETVSRFSAELPEETQIILHQRAQIMELFKQEGSFVSREVQTATLALVLTPFLKDKEYSYIVENKKIIAEALEKAPGLKEFTAKVLTFKDLGTLLKELNGLTEKLTEVIEKKVEKLTDKVGHPGPDPGPMTSSSLSEANIQIDPGSEPGMTTK